MSKRPEKLGMDCTCLRCGHHWYSVAKDIQCPKCKGRDVQIREEIEYVLAWLLGRINVKLEDILWRLNSIEKKIKKKGGEKK